VRSCAACGGAIDAERIGVRDTCPSCQAYLHACRNCDFYAPGASRDCREPTADLVADKEAGNFCDHFHWDVDRAAPAKGKRDDARARLDALFAKRPESR
jgi:hypothetical protein